jgi:hypothetical protein
MRQAKALFGGYSDTEREQFKPLIQASIVEAARYFRTFERIIFAF